MFNKLVSHPEKAANFRKTILSFDKALPERKYLLQIVIKQNFM